MKVIQKDKIKSEKIMHSFLENERRVLLEISHPFIVDTHYIFEDSKCAFFIMSFVQNGDISRSLRQKGYFKESQAKLYAAQVTIAIGFLHQCKIIYRDLKLENVLLDGDGYVKLADFGMSKFLNHTDEKMKSVMGTVPYMAPEMIASSNSEYDRMVDWWALGIMLFEMVFGMLPFDHKNQHMLFQKILKEKHVFPTEILVKKEGKLIKQSIDISDEAKDLINKLLEKDHTKRIGRREDDYREVINHPWFADINLEKLIKKEIRPIYLPKFAK